MYKINSTLAAMYNLQLSEEQLAIRDTVRDFVATEITPVALQPARLEPFDPPLPVDLIETAAALGLRSLALDEADGGAGADALTRCLVAEELAAGDMDVAAVLTETAVLGGLLFGQMMSADHRAAHLTNFVEDSAFHLALAAQEADADSGLGTAYHRPRAARSPVTTAVADGDDWVITGTKTRIANAPIAKLFVVIAASDAGTIALLVPRDAPGLSVQETPRDGGWYHGAMGDVALQECRVPTVNRLTGGNRDLTALADCGSVLAGTPEGQALNLGVARAAFDAALDYAKLRIQGGRPIVEHQSIGSMLADIAGSLELVRGAVWRAAWDTDNPQARADGSLADIPHALISQVAAADMLYRAAKDAAECFGAMGVMRDMPMQKYIHDTRLFRHSGNGVADARLRLAEALAGHEPR
jgi:alkylation response protein AidB-like acyl-CoA dehydrogenase